MNRNRQMKVNLIASVVVFLVQFSINICLSPYIISKLGEEANGFISLANNFTQYGMLLAVSVNSMSSRFISYEYNKGNIEKSKKYFSSVFWMNVIISIIIFIGGFFIVNNIELFINVNSSLINDVKITFLLSFLNLIVSLLTTCFISATFVANRMDLHAYTQILANLVKVFVVISLFLCFKPHIYYVSFATLCFSFVVFFIYVFIKKQLCNEFSINIRLFSISSTINLTKSGCWFLISNISSMFLKGLDLLIANRFINQIAMGRLAVAKQIPNAVGQLLGFMSNIFSASLTELVAKEDYKSVVNEVGYTCKVLGLFLSVPFAGIIIYGLEFLTLWLPQNSYSSTDLKQIYILLILILADTIVNAYMYSIHSLFIALDKVKTYSIFVFLGSFVSVVTTVIIVKHTNLGVYAIAGTSTIIMSIINLFIIPTYAESLLKEKNKCIKKAIFKNYVLLVILCATFMSLKLILKFDTWFVFIISIFLAGMIGYFVSFIVMFKKDERSKVIHTLIRKK